MDEESTILEKVIPAVVQYSFYAVIVGWYFLDKHTFIFHKMACSKLIKKHKNKQERKIILIYYDTIKKILIDQKDAHINVGLVKSVLSAFVRDMVDENAIAEIQSKYIEKACVYMLYRMIVSMRANGQITSFAPSSGIFTYESDHILRVCVDYLVEHGAKRETLEKMIPYAMDINYY